MVHEDKKHSRIHWNSCTILNILELHLDKPGDITYLSVSLHKSDIYWIAYARPTEKLELVVWWTLTCVYFEIKRGINLVKNTCGLHFASVQELQQEMNQADVSMISLTLYKYWYKH